MPQPLTPEDIRKTTFHVTMRGYARDEVDEFLNAMARAVGSLNERAETAYLNLGVKMGELLQEAKDAADELLSNARADVGNMLQEASIKAQELEQTSQAQAEDRVRTAEAHATKIIGEAEQRVAELTAAENAIREDLTSLRSQLGRITDRLQPLILPTGSGPVDEPADNGHQDLSITLEAPPPPLRLGTE
jgi:cell division initiation protein